MVSELQNPISWRCHQISKRKVEGCTSTQTSREKSGFASQPKEGTNTSQKVGIRTRECTLLRSCLQSYCWLQSGLHNRPKHRTSWSICTTGCRFFRRDPKIGCTASSTPSWRLWGIFFSSSRFLFCSLFSVIVLLLFSFFLLPLVFLYFSLLLFPARPLKRK